MADYIDDEAVSCSSSESESEEGASQVDAPATSTKTPRKKAVKTTTRAAPKRKSPTLDNIVVGVKKGKKTKVSTVKVDIAKSTNVVEIPEFEVHIGRDWFVKVSPFYGNDKYYVLLRNYASKKSYGANLPIEMIEEITKGFTLAQAHIQKHSRV